MTALEADLDDGIVRHRDWERVVTHAPQLALTGWRYLDQVAVSLRPATVDVVDNTLRCFAGWLVDTHPDVTGFTDVRRAHIEGFKLFFAARTTAAGTLPARNTIRQRLGTLRSFFDRIIEWDWPDAPARTPIFAVDVPIADDPLPRFLDDPQAARFAARAAQAPPFDRLVIELLSRTGMRVGELCTLAADAVVVLNNTPWLRVPVGKLHNDRYVPLHPNAARLLTDWTDLHPAVGGRLLRHADGRLLDRYRVARVVARVGRQAGLGHVHPHQLRHTLATQAINRGMRLEAIATMLGHRSLRMTLTYARIANKTVADEYATASAKIDALYTAADPEQRLAQLAVEHKRMLANGWCHRPALTDCVYETICEGCGYYQTTVEFLPTLRAQAAHATTNQQTERAELYTRLATEAAAG